MDLYFLRHAIAVERGSEGHTVDADRPLTPKGRKKMCRIAEGMLALELSFDQIITSPLARARETAEIVADVFHLEKHLAFSEHLEVGGSSMQLIDELNMRYGSRKGIVLVGHEPYLSGIVSVLLSGDDGMSLEFKKGGLCKLVVDTLRHGKCATLEWLLAPSQLTRIG